MSPKSAIVLLMVLLVLGRTCCGQPGSPVYPDDSPSAAAALSGMAGMVSSGNVQEAVRTLQQLLDESGDRVVESAHDTALFVSVRGEVHRQLLDEPALMTRYRDTFAGRAKTLLDEGRIEELERAYMMTSAGYEATLRLCQLQLEDARFNAAFLTLTQLEHHPDRGADDVDRGDSGAAALAAQIARYLTRDDVVAIAIRWAAEAGVGEIDISPFDRPALADVQVLTPMDGGEALLANQIPPKPMWTVPLENDGSLVMRGSSSRPPRESKVGLWTNPTIADDILLVNDTVWVRAWDRYTLEPLWRVKPGVEGPSNPQMLVEAWEQRTAQTVGRVQIEDTNSVSVWAHVAVTATGFATGNARAGDGRLHGLDVRTGEMLWSVSPSSGDNPNDRGTIRGPVMVDEGMAVVSMRRSARTRRVVSFSLMGVDALSGRIRWTRPIGSAGALPFANDRRIANSSVLDQGVVFASDQMGVIAAVEAETGRPIWVRRLGVSEIASGARTSAWQSISAVVHAEVVYMLTPTRDRIVAIDRHTGSIVASRTADRFDSPQYIIKAGKYLVAVGGRRVAVVPFDEFESGTIRLSERGPQSEIRGRAVSAGGLVYLPTPAGLMEIDPARPNEATRMIALDHAGTALPAGEQIIVVDDHAVHAYVSWKVADRVLQERMDTEPDLAAPAVSYADLAYRVGRTDRIVPAVDRALGAMERRPGDPSNKAARTRLFASLHAMALGWLDSPDTSTKQNEILARVTERLGRVAQSDAQEVEYLLVRGRMREALSEYEEAAATYGEILDSPRLREVERIDAGRRSSAAWAATLALRGLVLEHGSSASAGIDARAERARAAIGPDADAETLASFAANHPASRAAPLAWLRAAALYGEAGRVETQIATVRKALLSAEIVYSLDADSDIAPVEEAASDLVAALGAQGQSAEAAQVLTRVLMDYPTLMLGGQDGALLLEEIRRSATPRRARIGSTLSGKAQSIAGWTIMPTLVNDGDQGNSHIVLRSSERREFSLWGPIEALSDLHTRAISPDGPGSLAMLWSRTFKDFEPAIVRVDPDAVYLLWATLNGGEIEKVRAVDGKTIWRTKAFDTLFQPDAAFANRLTSRLRQPILFDTPMNVRRLVAELIVAADSDSVVIVERSGRLAVFDPDTGELVRTQVSAVQTVFSVDVSYGVAAIVGSAQVPDPDSGRVPVDPAADVFDARSGEKIKVPARLSSVPTWVRVADDHTVLIGMRDSIACIELAPASTRWSISNARGDEAVALSKAGWAFGQTVYVLGSTGQVTARSLRDGTLFGTGPLVGGGRFGRTDIRAFSVEDDRVAFLGGAGLVVADAKGVVVGMDSLDAARRVGIVRPAIGDTKVVAVERATVTDAQGRRINRVHIIASDSGELLGSRDVAMRITPTRVALLDGRIAISTAATTVVYATTRHASGDQR